MSPMYTLIQRPTAPRVGVWVTVAKEVGTSVSVVDADRLKVDPRDECFKRKNAEYVPVTATTLDIWMSNQQTLLHIATVPKIDSVHVERGVQY